MILLRSQSVIRVEVAKRTNLDLCSCSAISGKIMDYMGFDLFGMETIDLAEAMMESAIK